MRDTHFGALPSSFIHFHWEEVFLRAWIIATEGNHQLSTYLFKLDDVLIQITTDPFYFFA